MLKDPINSEEVTAVNIHSSNNAVASLTKHKLQKVQGEKKHTVITRNFNTSPSVKNRLKNQKIKRPK